MVEGPVPGCAIGESSGSSDQSKEGIRKDTKRHENERRCTKTNSRCPIRYSTAHVYLWDAKSVYSYSYEYSRVGNQNQEGFYYSHRLHIRSRGKKRSGRNRMKKRGEIALKRTRGLFRPLFHAFPRPSPRAVNHASNFAGLLHPAE